MQARGGKIADISKKGKKAGRQKSRKEGKKDGRKKRKNVVMTCKFKSARMQ